MAIRSPLPCAAHTAWPAFSGAGRAGSAPKPRPGIRGSKSLLLAAVAARGKTLRRARSGQDLDDAERAFQAAFKAESERCDLVAQQLQETLDRLRPGEGELQSSVHVDAASFAPDAGGKSSWREAFEAAKSLADSLERDLEKARRTGELEEPAHVQDQSPAAPSGGSAEALVVEKEWQEDSVKRLEAVAEFLEDETALRFIATPVLARDQEDVKLPPLRQVRELMKDLFNINSEVAFDRVYVLQGQVADSMAPDAALATMQQRAASAAMDVEFFLQRNSDSQAVLVMLHEDMPSNEFAWWQWLLCGSALLATLISVNMDAFSVTVGQLDVANQNVSDMAQLAQPTLPTAASIFAVVAAMEVARRTAASKYGVELTPPVFVPVWPLPSLGCFGAISRQQSIVPNEEANLAMSISAGLAGYATSILLVLIGLAVGPGEDQVSLNYQLLPLVLKFLLRPLLGESSVTEQPDPFRDPVELAFPASPILIGGVVGLVITSLNLLALGRLDGAVLARALRLNVSIIGVALLLSGSLSSSTGFMYGAFAFYAIILQGGYNSPARDAVSEPDAALKFLATALVASGIVLSIPGSLLPGL